LNFLREKKFDKYGHNLNCFYYNHSLYRTNQLNLLDILVLSTLGGSKKVIRQKCCDFSHSTGLCSFIGAIGFCATILDV
jgi:hypothetical protein